MDKHTLILIRETIAARRSALAEEIADQLKKLGLSNDPSALDRIEDSLSDVRDETAVAELVRDSDELKRLDQAQVRIDEGGYGVCESCGRNIPKDRLLAVPTALQCMECQEDYDKRHLTPRPATL